MHQPNTQINMMEVEKVLYISSTQPKLYVDCTRLEAWARSPYDHCMHAIELPKYKNILLWDIAKELEIRNDHFTVTLANHSTH